MRQIQLKTNRLYKIHLIGSPINRNVTQIPAIFENIPSQQRETLSFLAYVDDELVIIENITKMLFDKLVKFEAINQTVTVIRHCKNIGFEGSDEIEIVIPDEQYTFTERQMNILTDLHKTLTNMYCLVNNFNKNC